MRALVYKLSNGETVNTMTEAEASGLKYSTEMVDIPKPINVSPKQECIVKGLFGGEF